ncbi:MAG: sigma-70 family RNA polymerase sigma factor [Lachnospiraceae bacterium]|nr:sigma-70 family RNA polymerase sigma factor [Lachnospiraceae bacterium]
MEYSFSYLAEYVKRAANGDSNAFAELYSLTYSKIYNYARHYMKDDYLAEDAVQDIYISALKNLNKLNDPSLFIAWLNQIAFRVCFDMSKSRKQGYGEVSTDIMEELGDIKSSEITPEDSAFIKDEQSRLKEAIEALPLNERELITLRYFNDMKIDEIVNAIGISKSTVKRQLNLALEHLKRRMN